MVSKKNSERGFVVGCDAPVIPRARRSIRKKVSCKKTVDEARLCPFELLATVAGQLLLQETEASASASSSAAAIGLDRVASRKDQFIKQEIEGPLTAEQDDQGSSEESVVSSGRHLLKKCSGKDADEVTVKNQNASTFDSSVACSVKMDLKSANEMDGGGSAKCDYYSDAKSVGNGITNVKGESAVGSDQDELISAINKSRVKKGIDDGFRKRKRSIPKDTDNVQVFEKVVPLGRVGSIIPDRNGVKTGSSIYEDEILSQFFDQSNCKMKEHVGGRMMTSGSKNWSSCPKLKDFEGTNSDQIEVHDTPPKKRKIFYPSSVVTQECGVSSESVSNSTKKGLCENKSNPGIGMQSPNLERRRSFTSRNSSVKLSIKSFEVPELVIEVAESTTVGSLKKTILEAVARVFGEGLSVGLLHNGEKICDDGRSLLQTGGLSEEDNLDNLGFLLEPNTNTANLTTPTLPLPEDSPIDNTLKKNDVNRSELTPKVEANLLETLEKASVTDLGKTAVEGNNNRELVPFVPPPLPEKEKKSVSDSSRSNIIPVIEHVEALAVVEQKPKLRSEMGQRRTRRPFSVGEVEALVHAVETLGTGRWRDVKLSAFENAKHRTYVDLKDKWKTLVHTARISPQQRRGEPVPQELLDRVLAAHAYWSQHQARQQHGKHQQQAPLLLIEKFAAA